MAQISVTVLTPIRPKITPLGHPARTRSRTARGGRGYRERSHSSNRGHLGAPWDRPPGNRERHPRGHPKGHPKGHARATGSDRFFRLRSRRPDAHASRAHGTRDRIMRAVRHTHDMRAHTAYARAGRDIRGQRARTTSLRGSFGFGIWGADRPEDKPKVGHSKHPKRTRRGWVGVWA